MSTAEYSISQFKEFASALTAPERDAIRAWLNMRYICIKQFQERQREDQASAELERQFSSALQKAVVCHGIVFRGLSDRFKDPKAQDHMRSLIRGPCEFEFASHTPTSVCQEIAMGHTHTALEDEPRSLSVLLKAHCKTARFLRPFWHKPLNEREVVILKGSKYRRVRAQQLPNPHEGHELWIVEIEEVSSNNGLQRTAHRAAADAER